MADRTETQTRQGYPWMLGANPIEDGYNFAAEAPDDADVFLILYRKKSPDRTEEIPMTGRFGNVRTVMLPGFRPKDYEYNFRIGGRVVQDPCAYSIVGREHFGAPCAAGSDEIRCGFLPSRRYDWENDCPPDIPYEELILYKLHVRGYTKQYRLSPGKRGTFAGLTEMIPYWKELGINALELMPAYEFMEAEASGDVSGMVSARRQEGKVNFWGYLPGFYFAPKRSYCATSDPHREFRDMVKALHRAGMECIMEFYFPAETNTSAAVKALHFWATYYHVDGFHLVGDGVPAEQLLNDSILSRTKLMGQGFAEAVKRRRPLFAHRNLAQYDPGFLQDMRRFLKSDEDMLQAAEYRIRNNPGSHAVVNFMAYQDGFTLADAVSYNYRHNEANGENNNDGSSYNYSWNCGVEGPSRKAAVRRIRQRQMRNAFLMVLLSQGVPMIYGGDEIANSQNGNNNAYCQDNPVGWVDWKGLSRNRELLRFVQAAIAFRKEHPILHTVQELRGADYLTKGFPDISLHGEHAWFPDRDNTSRLIGIMYCGAYARKADGSPDDFIYVAYNFHWETRKIALPNLPDGAAWEKVMDTSEDEAASGSAGEKNTYQKTMEIGPRTIIVLTGRREA